MSAWLGVRPTGAARTERVSAGVAPSGAAPGPLMRALREDVRAAHGSPRSWPSGGSQTGWADPALP